MLGNNYADLSHISHQLSCSLLLLLLLQVRARSSRSLRTQSINAAQRSKGYLPTNLNLSLDPNLSLFLAPTRAQLIYLYPSQSHFAVPHLISVGEQTKQTEPIRVRPSSGEAKGQRRKHQKDPHRQRTPRKTGPKERKKERSGATLLYPPDQHHRSHPLFIHHPFFSSTSRSLLMPYLTPLLQHPPRINSIRVIIPYGLCHCRFSFIS